MKKGKLLLSLSATFLAVCAAGIFAVPVKAAGDVKINSTNFPDSTFRSYVSTNFDSDKNGSLSSSEIAKATTVDVLGKSSITKLKGIEYLTALNYLDFTGTGVTSVDLSKNTNLTKLYTNTKLSSLNVSKNTNLQTLSVGGLTSLDVTKNTKLTRLYCSFKSGQYSTLNLKNNPELITLEVWNAKSLDLSKNTKLQTLYLYRISGNVNFSNNKELVSLMFDSSSISSVDLSKNTKLERLYLTDDKLKSIDVSKNTALTNLTVYGNNLTSLNVSNNTNLYSLYCGDNPLTKLDVSKNTKLEFLSCGSTQIKSLNLANNKQLWALYCDKTNITSLDVSKNTQLEILTCSGNGISSLNLKNNKKLIRLECHNNKLTSLDLENNTALDKLLCHGNSLSKLNISTNPGLIDAYKKGTKIEAGVYYSFCSVVKFDSNAEGKYLKEDSAYKYIIYKKGVKVSTDAKPLPITLSSTNGNVKIAWEAFSKNGTAAAKYVIYKKNTSNKWAKIGTTSGTSYKDSSAIPGDPNTYTVLALDANGKQLTGYGDGTKISFCIDPVPITVTNKAAGILVKWNAVDKAENYDIFRKTKSGSWERLTTTTNLQYSDKKAVFAKTYYYSVRAKTKKGNYINKYGNGTAIARYVAAPEITLDNIGKGVEVRWKAVTNAAKYRVYVQDTDGSWKRIAIVKGKSCVDKDVVKGKTYTYSVVAVDANDRPMNKNGSGASIVRKVVSPTSVTATVKSTGVRLEWKAISNAESYTVFRKTGSGSWSQVGSTSGLSYIDKNVKSGTTYYYSVIAYNTRGKALNDYGNGVKIKFTKTSTKGMLTKDGFIDVEVLGEGIVEELLEEDALEEIEEDSEDEIIEEDSEEIEEDSEEDIDEEDSEETEEDSEVTDEDEITDDDGTDEDVTDEDVIADDDVTDDTTDEDVIAEDDVTDEETVGEEDSEISEEDSETAEDTEAAEEEAEAESEE